MCAGSDQRSLLAPANTLTGGNLFVFAMVQGKRSTNPRYIWISMNSEKDIKATWTVCWWMGKQEGGQTGEDVDLNSTCIFHGFHIYLINRIPQKLFGQLLIFLFSNSKFKYLLIIFSMNSLV